MSYDLIIENLKKEIENSLSGLIINAKIITNAKKNSIEKMTDDVYKIKVTQIAVDGKANICIINFLSDILDVPKSKIKILKGEKSNHKTILINKN